MKKFLIGLLVGVSLSAIPIALAFPPPLAPSFSDVPSDAWFSSAVDLTYKRGLIKGYSDNTFRPNNNVNRAEVVQMLAASVRTAENRNGEQDDYFQASIEALNNKLGALTSPQGECYYANKWYKKDDEITDRTDPVGIPRLWVNSTRGHCTCRQGGYIGCYYDP